MIDFAKNKFQKIRKEVKEAYADRWHGKNADKRRNLDFKASGDVSREEAIYILKQAIPNGYNVFNANLIDNLPLNVSIIIAREGSVYLYIKGWKNPSNQWMMADEFTIEDDGTVILWWD